MVQKFKRNLILNSFFGTLISGIIIAVVSISPLAEKLKETETDHLSFAAKTRILAIENFLDHIKETAAQISSRTRMREALEQYNNGEISLDEVRAATIPKFKDGFNFSKEIKGVSRFDVQNNLIMQVNMSVPEEYYFIPPDTAESPVVTGPVLIDAEPYLIVSTPVFNRKFDRVGTDIYLFTPTELETIINDHGGLGESGEAILGMFSNDKSVQFFASRKQQNLAKEYLYTTQDSLIGDVIRKTGAAGNSAAIITADETRTCASYFIEEVNWVLLAVIDNRELFAPLNEQLKNTAIAIAFLIVAVTMVLLLLLRPLANSVLVHTDKLQNDLDQLALAEGMRKLNEERMESLLQIYQLTETDEKKIAHFALEEGVRLTGSEAGYLHFFDDDELHIQLSSWSSQVAKQCTTEKESHYPLDKAGIWADSIRQKKPVIHNDFTNAPEKKGYPDGHFPVIRHMSVPIMDGNRCVGVSGVGNKQEPYDESDVRQLSLFMNSMWGILKQRRSEEERKHLQHQLLQAQKMEMVGRFSGGIAHDFNNLLTTILGYSEFLLRRQPPKDKARELLQLIYEAGDKGARLIKQLLAFSRKQVLDAQVVEINGVVTKMSKLLHRLIGEDIELITVLSEHEVTIEADVSQIEQVIMNMAVNAKDAMPEGGKLIISVGETSSDNLEKNNITIKPGQYATLTFKDTGIGMSKEVQERIFEPFYTTKEQGKGTGLGLSTVFGVINQHQGHIDVASSPGDGSTFSVYLPKSLHAKGDASLPPEKILTAGTETILVVDDYASVRELIKHSLQPLGYTIFEAASAEEALEILKTPVDINMVLTDVIMPGIKGSELADIVRMSDPEIKIAFMSGYSDDYVKKGENAQELIHFISKPIVPSKLEVFIRKVLDH